MKTPQLTVATVLFLILYPLTIANGTSCGRDIDDKPQLQHIDEMLTNGQNQQALHLLELISAPEDPDSAARLWRLARVYYEMGRLD